FIRGGDRFIDRQHSQLVAVVRDHPHRTDPDLPIDAGARCFAVVLERWQVCSLLLRSKNGPRLPQIRCAPRRQPWSFGTRERSLQERGIGWGVIAPTYHIVDGKLVQSFLVHKPDALPFLSQSTADDRRV